MSFGVGKPEGYPYNLSTGDQQQIASLGGGNYGCQAPTWRPQYSTDEGIENFCPYAQSGGCPYASQGGRGPPWLRNDDDYGMGHGMMRRYGMGPGMMGGYGGPMLLHGWVPSLLCILVILAFYYVATH